MFPGEITEEVCGAISHKMDELIVIKHQSEWKPAFNLYVYIHVYTLPYFHHSKMITSFHNVLDKFSYSNSHFLTFIYLCVCVCVFQ